MFLDLLSGRKDKHELRTSDWEHGSDSKQGSTYLLEYYSQEGEN